MMPLARSWPGSNPTTGVVGSLFDNPILFTSREFDAETGLYYNRARYLDPTTGRWTTQDPMGFAAGDANLYRYVGNRATLATDPSGNLIFVPVLIIGGLLVGGSAAYTGYQSYQSTGSAFNGQIWGAYGDGLRIGGQANVNAIPTAARSLVTLGIWAEPWEVWAVDEVDRPYYNDAFLAARLGWELLPTAGIGRLTQTAGQMGRWGRWALVWDAGQNAVQAGRGGYDIYENGLTWTNGLQVIGSLLGLGGNYTTWRRLPGAAPRQIAPASGQGMIGLVRSGGTQTPWLADIYIDIARSPEFARSLERYNAIARRLGQTQAASVDEIIAALRSDVTFSRIGHLRSGVFTAGQHPGSTQFWLQGNPLTSYGRRVGRHELTHLGAALRGQRDTLLHEIAVQAATTPENLIIAGGAVGVIIGGEIYYLFIRR